RSDRPGDGCVCAGDHLLRIADRAEAVPGKWGHADPDPVTGEEAGTSTTTPAGDTPRPGADLPQMPGKAAVPALRHGGGPGRRPGMVPQRGSDPGAFRPDIGSGPAHRRRSPRRSAAPSSHDLCPAGRGSGAPATPLLVQALARGAGSP